MFPEDGTWGRRAKPERWKGDGRRHAAGCAVHVFSPDGIISSIFQLADIHERTVYVKIVLAYSSVINIPESHLCLLECFTSAEPKFYRCCTIFVFQKITFTTGIVYELLCDSIAHILLANAATQALIMTLRDTKCPQSATNELTKRGP